MSLCVDIRKASRTPIIFVTSWDSASDELRALSLGGDDYITKPYNIPVLLAVRYPSFSNSRPNSSRMAGSSSIIMIFGIVPIHLPLNGLSSKSPSNVTVDNEAEPAQ